MNTSASESEDPHVVQIARSLSVNDDALLTSAGEAKWLSPFASFFVKYFNNYMIPDASTAETKRLQNNQMTPSYKPT